VDVEHLVGDPVPVERAGRHRFGGSDDAEHDVVVEVKRDPAADRVAFGWHRPGLRQAMTMQTVIGCHQLHSADGLDPVRLRRRHEVVQDRISAAEALDAEEFLGIEAAVGTAVLRVPLAGQAAVRDVIHADWPPRLDEASLGGSRKTTGQALRNFTFVAAGRPGLPIAADAAPTRQA
jgi:hypothetical protein